MDHLTARAVLLYLPTGFVNCLSGSCLAVVEFSADEEHRADVEYCAGVEYRVHPGARRPHTRKIFHHKIVF